MKRRVPIVDQLSELEREIAEQTVDFTILGDTLDIQMCLTENSSSRCLINSILNDFSYHIIHIYKNTHELLT